MAGLRGSFAVIGASTGLAIAGVTASLGVASECSTAHQIHWWIAAPFFALFLFAGGYVFAAGSTAQRLTLFVALAVIVAAYVTGLALSLPMVVKTEISCAADGAR